MPAGCAHDLPSALGAMRGGKGIGRSRAGSAPLMVAGWWHLSSKARRARTRNVRPCARAATTRGTGSRRLPASMPSTG
nr:hypothetical protein [Cupriavidus sp. IDO]